MLTSDGRTRISSYALIRDADRLLLCRISNQVPNSAGRWTLPGGGIEFGEHPEHAAVRETYEETGLDIKIRKLAMVDSELYRFPEGPMHAVRMLYYADVIGGTLRNELQGSTDMCDWFTREQLRKTPLVSLVRTAMGIAFSRN